MTYSPTRITRTVSRASLAMGLAAVITAGALIAAPPSEASVAGTVFPHVAATVPVDLPDLSFESGLDGWTPTGTVAVVNDPASAHDGSRYAELAAGASISRTITDIPQGSYTLASWTKGAASNNNAALTTSNTGAPNTTVLIDAHLGGADAWTQPSHRNVLVYNGQLTITVTAGSSALKLDGLTLVLDAADQNPLENWNLENGLDGWATTAGSSVAIETATPDTGTAAARLGPGAELAQTVQVEPNTRYTVTARVRVERTDTFDTAIQTDQYGPTGALVTRTSTGDRINLGVRTAGGTVLRQAPASTDGYSLATVTFTTGPVDDEVTIYANTISDAAYSDSVSVYIGDSAPAPADDWSGNLGQAWVDNFDMFTYGDQRYVRGADVSNIQLIEDNGGKYFANGVQQDGLRILSNHGVNSVTGMIFVHAGQTLYDETPSPIYLGGTRYAERLKLAPAEYFDKDHTVALAVRADALGMSFLPSFHYSDYFMTAGKASTPYEWLNQKYDGTLSNSDIAHLKSVVYNYVFDFMTDLKAADVDVVGVKHGNEQNGGVLWPVGQGATSAGHAAVISASYDATEAVWPGLSGYTHSNNGYDTGAAQSFFKGLAAKGAKFDGAAFSLYGGRSSANILKMAEMINADAELRFRDYLNVETAVSFTKYKATWATESAITPQAQYYRTSANGQYNWLLDYMQAPLDVPNPYGQTRGFYYWEIDWIPVAGAGAKQLIPTDISSRTMFNNGDAAIKAMGDSRAGKPGDMLDSMYAYLMRAVSKNKTESQSTALNEPGVHGPYSVDVTAPTGIALSESNISLKIGDTVRLHPTVQPTDKVLAGPITYRSSDTSIAAVTADGFVHAVSAGDATVTARVAGGHTATVTISVAEPAKAASGDVSVTVNGKAVIDGAVVSAVATDKLQLTASVPAAVSDRTVTYRSATPANASFFGETWQTEPGQLRAYSGEGNVVQLEVRNAGDTTISVTTGDGHASLSFTLRSTKTAVTGMTLDKTDVVVGLGSTARVTAKVAPSNATLYKVEWTLADPSIASVDGAGNVTGLQKGQTTLTATSIDNPTITATATVDVGNVPVSALSIIPDALTIEQGATRALTSRIAPADAGDKTLSWTTSDSEVATVTSAGVVTGIAPGEADITATTTDGTGISAVARVAVSATSVAATALTLDATEYYFRADAFSDLPTGSNPTREFAVAVTPAGATNAEIVWSSDTPSVATVDEFGTVTGVAAGVARVTATTKDGSVSTAAQVYVPTLSESFESRASTYAWGLTQTGGIPTMASKVGSGNGGQSLILTSKAGNGASAIQKYLVRPVTNNRVVVDATYNVATPGTDKGGYFTIADDKSGRFLTLRVDDTGELFFGNGGRLDAASSTTALSGMTPVGPGFTAKNAWYDLHAVIDFEAKSVSFRLTSKADPSITAEHTLPFDPNTVYTGTIARLQFWTPSSSAGTWWPTLDNVNIYAAAPVAKAVTADPTTVRLIPVEGTLGVSHQLSADVAPAAAPQDVTWTSSNPDVVTVDANGLVTATRRYASLNDVVPATADITVASKATPSVSAKVRIEITDTPHASELLSIVDTDGTELTGSDEAWELEKNDAAVMLARATGGDGDTDVARIEWSSGDSRIVSVQQGDAPIMGTTVTAVSGGTTTVTVKVWIYTTSSPLTASVTVTVPEDLPQDSGPPSQANLSTTSGWATGLHDGTFDVKMDLWWGTNARSFRLFQDGALVATVPLTANGLEAQHALVPIRGLKNGTYEFTGELVNTAGRTATNKVTVTVTHANPAKPAVRVEGSGAERRLLTDLWWGTNATGYRILDGTTVIAEGPLAASTPSAQHIVTDLGQLAVGPHTLVAELYNDAGVTRSDPVNVVG